MIFSRIKVFTILLCSLLALSYPGYVDCAKKGASLQDGGKGSTGSAPSPPIPEAIIEEVNAKQLEKILNDKDYVAVFWYARSCVTCDKVLAELEKIDDDTDSFGVDFVKINDKRLAKQYGIRNFPALTYFREKEPIIYDGDLMDEEGVLDFLTSLEAMDLPDRIEEVNSKILSKIIEDTDYVAVLFCPDHTTCPPRVMDKTDCKKCAKALQELENIDDEADQLGIGFVKIHDEALADEYNLGSLPALVYYRHQTPIIYEGELSREEDVLEWLVQNKSTGDEDDVIEDVTAKTLGTLINNIDNLVVLFYDHGDDDSMTVLEELEKIDDDCDKHGIQFVKIDDANAADDFGIESIPSIVYFEKQVPNVYDGDLMDEDEILQWLLGQLESDEIEDVTDEMLDKLVKEGKTLAVLFYDNNDKKSQKILDELESIDDECDALGITFVKIDNADEAKEYGIEKVPKLIYFEKGIPTIYEGNLEDEMKLLKWLEAQTNSDQIEDVTDEMLDLIIEKMSHVAVLFYDKDQKKSQKVLAELENIDDECDQNDIAFVKIDDDKEAEEWGIETLPTIVFFERSIPHIYEGDLMKEDELLGWLIHQKRHSEIPEVTDEMKDKLVETTEFLAVIFYDKDDKQDIRVLNELENIDDELEKEGIVIVRIDNAAEAKEYGIDHLPALIYFEDKIPALYEGDLMNEEEVLEWLILQKQTSTIEEVTDEILVDLIEEHEYVVVYFTGPCEPGQKCDKILDNLESIDDELDEAGIIFVTTEDMQLAKKYSIKNLPQLVFFRNRDPLLFTGDVHDEDEVLSWLTDENTLEIPGKIEEVNMKMLEKILAENDHIVVFFYRENDKKSLKILNELENIDDECEEKNIDFVKTSDEGVDKEYDLAQLPALAFYRNKFRTIYTGDLMKEEEILDWVLELYESNADVIESVDRKTLQVLINDIEHLAVFFYNDDCESCAQVLEELETIDDDTDKYGIQFVKSNDVKLAHEIGIFAFPALVYYETGVPIMYDGNLKNEERVLQWLIDQKRNDDDDDDNEDDEENGDDDDDDDDNDNKKKTQQKHKTKTNKNKSKNDDDDDDEDNDDKVLRNKKSRAKSTWGRGKRDNDEDDNNDEDDDNGNDNDEDDNDNELSRTKKSKTKNMRKKGDDDQKHSVHKRLLGRRKIVKDEDDNEDDDDDEDEDEDGDNGNDDEDEDDDDEDDDEEVSKSKKNKARNVRIRGIKTSEEDDDKRRSLHKRRLSQKRIKVDEDDDDNDEDEDDDNDDEDEDDGNENDDEDDDDDDDDDEEESISKTKRSRISRKPNEHDDDKDDKNASSRKKHVREAKKKDDNDDADDDEDDDEEKRKSKPKWKNARLDIDEDDEDDEDNDNDNDEDEDEDNGENDDDDENDNVRKSRRTTFDRISFFKKSLLDDECFYVGLGQHGSRKKSGSTHAPSDYKPFQCCPTKLEKSTKVPKMTAQRITHESDKQSDHFKFVTARSAQKTPSSSRGKVPLSKTSTATPTKKPTSPQAVASTGKKTIPSVPLKKDTKSKDLDNNEKNLKGSNKKALANKDGKVKEGSLQSKEEVFKWILEQKNDESIDEIDRDTLFDYVATKDFMAVVFYKEEDPQTPRILRHIELIDDEAAEYGILVVKMSDRLMAKKYGFRNPPGITYFRKGKYINYDGDIDDEEEILDWLTSPENMEMTDNIEKVNRKMFEKIRKTSDYLAVYFYSDECKQCPRVLAEIEHIDDEADNAGIDFVKIDDKQMAKEYGVFALPAILFFKATSKDPVIYAGDLYEEEQILNWLMTQKDPGGDVIEDLEGERLVHLIEESGSIAVYFWNKTQCDICNTKAARRARLKKEREQQQETFGDHSEHGDQHHQQQHHQSHHDDDVDGCEQCTKVLEELENIDDDCDKHGIIFVKTKDFAVADGYGVHDYPALVYFEGGVPNVFEGELNEEEEVLQWLITQKTEDRIELITRQMLEQMVEETQYLAVYFYKINCNICDQILEGLELIDDECDVFGIHMVKIQDPQLAKRYSIKTFPALVYFRNGNPLLFEGDLQNEQSVLEWLIDDDNRELADEIEEVNERMLERLMDESPLLVVFFYDTDCAECEEILEELEEIDGEADMFGIDFVKIASVEAAQKYEIVNIPSLVYFRKRIPMLYDGDLHQHDKILTWLTSQDIFEIKNEIEEVNRKMLDKLLDENEFLIVYFYEHKHPDSVAALEKLENIDSETDNLDITFVKMADSRYARKWGVTKLPALVYFRKRFPSIYRGDLLSEDEVLEWLRKNRFRQPELNIFMYALLALAVGFVIYTAFLLQCFKPAPPPPPQHPKQQ